MPRHTDDMTLDSRHHGVLAHAFRVIAVSLVLLIAAVTAFITLTERWVFDTWVGLTLDELQFYLGVSLSGTNPDILWSYFWNYGLSVFLLVVIIALVGFVLSEDPVLFRRYLGTLALISCFALSWTWHDVDQRLGVTSYLSGDVEEASFEEENGSGEEREAVELRVGSAIVDANDVKVIFPGPKRNLIYLYLESMEMTYADVGSGGAYKENYIEELTTLAMENEDFSGEERVLNGAIAYPGATWTSGAMFAQTAGLPLRGAKGTTTQQGLVQSNDFIPGIRALGDILADEGYQQELLIGSEAAFGSRRELFLTHGGYEMYDYEKAIEQRDIPYGYRVWWGFEDARLFDIAKDELSNLSKTKQPFNLTILTVDTHFEDGYVCELCQGKYDEQYANVIACSSKQVADFILWVQGQPFYEDTTIVICGDHPTMDKDFCKDVPEDYQRRTYTCIINPAVIAENPEQYRTYSTFDMYPTTLASIGAVIPGERLGLGTNLFSSVPTLSEEYGVDQMSMMSRQVNDLYTLFNGGDPAGVVFERDAYLA